MPFLFVVPSMVIEVVRAVPGLGFTDSRRDSLIFSVVNYYLQDTCIVLMSQFENYTKTSENYDLTREPIGLEVILGVLASGNPSLTEQQVLDAGCGTGNYVTALADNVARLEGVEFNGGMLSAARAKVADRDDVRLQQGNILDLPLEDGSCHGVVVNFVLHHLEEGSDPDFSATRRAVAECERVLAPGGALIIQTCSATQYHEAYWYASLIPRAVNRAVQRYMPLDMMEASMEEAGLTPGGRFVPTHAVLQGDAYLDPRGPLREEWRDGDSSWALLDEEELGEVTAKIQRMLAEDTMGAFLEEREKQRLMHGQATFMVGRKPVS
jgi:ubiquinone/menaquinone biosynthesis C-methylase UbiE